MNIDEFHQSEFHACHRALRAACGLLLAVASGAAPADVLVNESGGATTVAEGGAIDSYTVVLTRAPDAEVRVVANPGEQLQASPASLVFTPASWNRPQTVTVSALDDAVPEGPHAARIAHEAVSGDLGYGGQPVADVVANLIDNDRGDVVVRESAGATAVTEGGAPDSYTLALTRPPTADIVIRITADSEATPEWPRLVVTPAELRFTPQDYAPRTVTVQAVDDRRIDPRGAIDTLRHHIVSADAVYSSVAVNAVTVTLTDNDGPGIVLEETGGATRVAEGGTTDVYALALATQPDTAVTITVEFDGRQLGVTPASVTFNATNYAVPQTITVWAVDDIDGEGPLMSTLRHRVDSGDLAYHAIEVDALPVAITDNDTPAVVISETAGSTRLTEGGAGDSYSLSLTQRPSGTVTIAIGADGRVTADPHELTFDPTNFATPRTVQLLAADDGVRQGPRLATVTHALSVDSTDSNYHDVVVDDLAAEIADGDALSKVATGSGAGGGGGLGWAALAGLFGFAGLAWFGRRRWRQWG